MWQRPDAAAAAEDYLPKTNPLSSQYFSAAAEYCRQNYEVEQDKMSCGKKRQNVMPDKPFFLLSDHKSWEAQTLADPTCPSKMRTSPMPSRATSRKLNHYRNVLIPY